jgi:tripartite-type tricarboxylate transporter receptor subunit TctC
MRAARAMTTALKQTAIIENAGGAGGNIGVDKVAKARPDGCTILLHHIGMSTSPALYRKLNYNALTDFEYIGLVADVPMTLVARQTFPAKDFKELLSYVKANRDKVTLANAGRGGVSSYATPCFLNQVSMRFQPSSAASLR